MKKKAVIGIVTRLCREKRYELKKKIAYTINNHVQRSMWVVKLRLLGNDVNLLMSVCVSAHAVRGLFRSRLCRRWVILYTFIINVAI